jgi:hypothetical protein
MTQPVARNLSLKGKTSRHYPVESFDQTNRLVHLHNTAGLLLWQVARIAEKPKVEKSLQVVGLDYVESLYVGTPLRCVGYAYWRCLSAGRT